MNIFKKLISWVAITAYDAIVEHKEKKYAPMAAEVHKRLFFAMNGDAYQVENGEAEKI